MQWDRKLDARLAMALMSIQAIKGSRSESALMPPADPVPVCMMKFITRTAIDETAIMPVELKGDVKW